MIPDSADIFNNAFRIIGNGVPIDVYERYKVVNFYGGQRIVDGKIKKGTL